MAKAKRPAAFGPVGSAFGSTGMMYLVHGCGQAVAAGLEAGIEYAAQKAATLGRDEAEAKKFADTVKTTGEMALTVAALTGLRKGVATLLRRPQRAVAWPANSLFDALSERPVVRNGKVFLGERELGALKQAELPITPNASKSVPLKGPASKAKSSKGTVLEQAELPLAPNASKSVPLKGPASKAMSSKGTMLEQAAPPLTSKASRAKGPSATSQVGLRSLKRPIETAPPPHQLPLSQPP